jgi:hypothetical protein
LKGPNSAFLRITAVFPCDFLPSAAVRAVDNDVMKIAADRRARNAMTRI